MEDTYIIVVNVQEGGTAFYCLHFLHWHLNSFSVAKISPTSITFVLSFMALLLLENSGPYCDGYQLSNLEVLYERC